MTTLLSAEKYVTGSLVILMICRLKTKLRQHTRDDTDPMIRLMAENMLRFTMLEGKSALAFSTFLDPRFKQEGFSNDVSFKSTKNKVEDIMRSMSRADINDGDCIENPEENNEERNSIID